MDIRIREFAESGVRRLAEVYAVCFAEPPWNEVFDVDEVVDEFREMAQWDDGVIVIAEVDGVIVGGSIGFKMSRKADVCELLDDADGVFYLAELFVSSKCRRMGIATQLVRARAEIARGLGFTEAVVRTSTDQTIIRRLYAGMGFEVVAEQTVESLKVVDGVEVMAPDTRILIRGSI